MQMEFRYKYIRLHLAQELAMQNSVLVGRIILKFKGYRKIFQSVKWGVGVSIYIKIKHVIGNTQYS
jgi:hypothetical protein